MSAELPPPAPTPPSIEAAVREHLDVIHEVRELRRIAEGLCDRQAAVAIAVTSLAGDVGRVSDRQTTDSFTLVRLERRVAGVEQKVDTLLKNQLALMAHLGVPHA